MALTIAIVGNPNVGKTELFNALTGLAQRTGNYPGVTVHRKSGDVQLNGTAGRVVDLPGSYSMAARSPDEMIVADVLLNQQEREQPIDAILAVVDASNLKRNLYFLSQIRELEKPIVVALNMMDIAEKRGIDIDAEQLSEALGVPVVPVRAHKRVGIDALKRTMGEHFLKGALPAAGGPEFSEALMAQVSDLHEELNRHQDKVGRPVSRIEAFRLLTDAGGQGEKRFARLIGRDIIKSLKERRQAASTNGSLARHEASRRYAWADAVVSESVSRDRELPVTASDRIDRFLTHRVWGSLFFLLVMLVVFQSIYSWAAAVMDAIDMLFASLGRLATSVLPEGILQSLVVDGAIAGIGSVVIFLPQILFLSFFVAVLEDCGYMARAAFLMDKLFSWCGLSGQSFIPMLSSFACAIPGIMATRTIENRRDRFTTIMVAPLMSCSARLPVYVIMIAAFVPERSVLGGLLGLQALTLFCMYMLGVVVALPMALLLKKTVFRGEPPPFVMELPSYKKPQLRTTTLKVYFQGREFLYRAGTTIFAVAVIVWALAYFPHSASVTEQFEASRNTLAESGLEAGALDEALSALSREEGRAHLENSYLGRMGHGIEPIVKPLGWDWRIGTAVIASFPAREIIVATLGIIFSMGDDMDETSKGLRVALEQATTPEGEPLFNLPVALSVMVFFALCMQCAATLVMIRRETATWRWPVYTFTYMTVLAYIGAAATFHLTTWLGWGGI